MPGGVVDELSRRRSSPPTVRGATTVGDGRPRAASPLGTSAKAFLLTMLGELVLPHGGEVWTSTVVSGLGLLGVEERNARQAIARLADQGTLARRGRGGGPVGT